MQIVRPSTDEVIQKLVRGGNVTKSEQASTAQRLLKQIADAEPMSHVQLAAASQLVQLQHLTGIGQVSDAVTKSAPPVARALPVARAFAGRPSASTMSMEQAMNIIKAAGSR